MGTKVAPSYANIYMGYFEHKHVYPYHLQPKIWRRFIDDIFIVWTHGLDELLKFVAHLNSCHESIKFTLEHSYTESNFLDVKVLTGPNGGLSTTLYCKPTDSHNYLLYSSEHPRHVLKGIPYSQFLRVRRTCSLVSEYRRNALMLCSHFLRRGYPRDLVFQAIIKAEVQPRAKLLTVKEKSTDKERAFYCIITHNPANPPIQSIIRINWDQLLKSKLTRVYHDAKLVFGKRKNKSLRDELVRASTSTKPKGPTQPHILRFPCKMRNNILGCNYCPLFDHSGYITSTVTGKKYRTLINVNCQSANVIYVLTCNTCNIQYVGQTERAVIERLKGHRFDVTSTLGQDTTVSRHYKACLSSELPKLRWEKGPKISILSFIKHSPTSPEGAAERNEEEKRWMHRLCCITPKGLNLLD